MTYEEVKERLVGYETRDIRITELSRAYRIELGTGCPAWGTSDIRFIGDRLGDLVITYADGTVDTVPLILGYTLWLHSTWMETPAPFMGEGKDDALAARLMETLSLYGAWDRREKWLLRVVLRDLPVIGVEVVGDPEKNPARPVLSVYTVPWGTTEDQPLKKGTPVFTEAYITDTETLPDLGEDAPAFFASHTVDPRSLPMDRITEALAVLGRALHGVLCGSCLPCGPSQGLILGEI